MKKKNNINDEFTVILRSIGERTTSLCYKLIKKQISEKNIHLVRETPNVKAIRKYYEIAIESNKKWTFVIDADILIKTNCINEFFYYTKNVSKNIFCIEGFIIDKFLDSPRPGGRILRTSLLQTAYKLIPDAKDTIRPDSYIRNSMQKLGYNFIKTNIIIGLHDYEQYYKDIYRKSFVQAKKHNCKVKKIINFWEQRQNQDNDFKIALKGFNDGEKYNGKITIDACYFKENFLEQRLEACNLSEKKNLTQNNELEIEKSIDLMSDFGTFVLHKRQEIINELKHSWNYKIGNIILLVPKLIFNFFKS